MIFIRPQKTGQRTNSDAYVLLYGSWERYGKMQKLARYSLSYGGSYKTASYVSGLGLRRVKVIAKQLRGL